MVTFTRAAVIAWTPGLLGLPRKLSALFKVTYSRIEQRVEN
jgi:hypothetical protein